MTFRVDDLMMAVLPTHMADDVGCDGDSKTQNTETACNDINTRGCAYCAQGSIDCTATGNDDAPDEPKKKERAWRDEQFALLSRELEDALAR